MYYVPCLLVQPTKAVSSTVPQSSSLTTSSITALPLLLADQPEDIYDYDVSHDDENKPEDDVTPKIQIIAGRDNRVIGITSIVLGVLLLISLVIILIILVHLCGLRDKLKEAELNKSKHDLANPPSSNPAHCATAAASRQVMTPVETNVSTKSPLLANDMDDRPNDNTYSDQTKPQIVGNWEIHGDVYVDVDTRT